jgi:hypothetical protein
MSVRVSPGVSCPSLMRFLLNCRGRGLMPKFEIFSNIGAKMRGRLVLNRNRICRPRRPSPRHPPWSLDLWGAKSRVDQPYTRCPEWDTAAEIGLIFFGRSFLTFISGGYLIGNLKIMDPDPRPPLHWQISPGDKAGTESMPFPCAPAPLGRKHAFPGLSHFDGCWRHFDRNSYRSLLCHIYELVKLGSSWTQSSTVTAKKYLKLSLKLTSLEHS